MKILLAPDSFKGAISAPDAAKAMARGWQRVWPGAECVLLPVADGGEGTLDTLLAATGGQRFAQTVCGPLGAPVSAFWGLLGDGETVVVELAQAAGLTQVPPDLRDPKITTTYGVGELLRAALTHPSVRRVLIGLGGSATNDGGAGILTALGVHLGDKNNNPLPPGGAALARLTTVSRGDFPFDPSRITVWIASDVNNPLTGPRGASAIFGPQKGATASDIALLDNALTNFARVLGINADLPGAGAAGGAAAGLLWLFGRSAQIHPGIDLVLDAIGFDAHLQNADLVLTGEGRLDNQTLGGKVIAGIARRAKAAGVPVGALVGSLSADMDHAALAGGGVEATLALAPGPCTLEESVAHTSDWLEAAAERAARWFRLGQRQAA